MDENFRGAGLASDPEQGEKMFKVRVDATVGDEADEVKSLARRGPDRLLEDLILGEGAVADGKVDAGEFLIDDATGAEVEHQEIPRAGYAWDYPQFGSTRDVMLPAPGAAGQVAARPWPAMAAQTAATVAGFFALNLAQ